MCMREALGGLQNTAGGPAELSGAKAMVVNLGARPELNGLVGVVGRYDQTRRRYAFKPDTGGEGLWLKAESLMAVEAAGDAGR
eukprot:scaffold35108_cov73-Isochrysis_galbana.AAC.1